MRLSLTLLSFMLLGQAPYSAPEWTPVVATKSVRPAYYSRAVAVHAPRGLRRFAWYEVPHTAAYSPESGCLFVASEALPHPPPEYDHDSESAEGWLFLVLNGDVSIEEMRAAICEDREPTRKS